MDNAIQTAQIAITPELVERIAAKYDDPLQAIVRPEVVMGVSRYFVERWVPVLGTSQATLVNTLRQLTYHNPKEAVTLSGERLAQEASMSRRHLYKCLKSPWVGIFVQVESGKKIKREGRTTRPPNRYTVRTEDPLTPADAQHLLDLLRELSDNPLEALRQALEIPPRQLWADSPLTPAQTRFAKPKPIFVNEVARRAFPNWKAADEDERALFAVLSDFLHKHITFVRADGRVSKVIVPQYFRQRWWPLLGHDLAWIYLWFRSRTYENPITGAHRQTCWVPSLNTLLEVIGRPREWWRRNVDRAKHGSKGWTIKEFFVQIETQKGRNPNQPQQVARCFSVQFEIPVTPDNRQYYTDLRLYWPLPPEDEEEGAAQPASAQESTLSWEERLDQVTAQAREDLARLAAKAATRSASESEKAPTSSQAAPLPPAILAAMRAVETTQATDQLTQAQPTSPSLEERLQAALTARLGRPPSKQSDKIINRSYNEDTTSHIRAQREDGQPHSYTINDPVTATSVHNSTPPSATSVHKGLPHSRTGSKILNKTLQEESHLLTTSNRSAGDPAPPQGASPPPAAETRPPLNGGGGEKIESPEREEEIEEEIRLFEVTLSEYIDRALRQTPELPFYKAAPLKDWVQQGMDPPVTPQTPAWKNMMFRIPYHDAVALLLAVWAKKGIFNLPRHLSWVTEKYLVSPDNPPVDYWPHFRKLAVMPIGQWPKDGRPLWRKITKRPGKRLPWDLDEVFHKAIHDGAIPNPWKQHAYTSWQWRDEDEDEEPPNDGLDEHPGGKLFTAYGVWHVAWNQLKRQLGDEVYFAWLDQCEVVYYADEELYICVPDQKTLDVLENTYRDLIVERVSGVALTPLRVRFVLEDERLPFEEEAENAPDQAEDKGGARKGETDAEAPPSAPDDSS